MKRFIFLIIACICMAVLISNCHTDRGKETTRGLIVKNGMVVTAHPIASKVGAEIMKKGGNAIDAAIAVQFALCVVHPAAGNIGGGGFLVYRDIKGQAFSLDFREKAPIKAHRNMYLDSTGEIIDNLSTLGHLAAGVPGSVDGMVTAYEKFGTLPWEELIQPAIDLANEGFVLTEKEASGLNHQMQNFTEANTIFPAFLYKSIWTAGDSIKNKELAQTLARIQKLKRDGFYSGESARLLLAEMERGNGLISLEDLNNYRSVWRDPVINTYKSYRIISMGPPSSGGIALSQLMQMVEPFDLKQAGWNSIRYIHTMAEVEKRVYADRAEHLGDMDYYPVPMTHLLDREYNHARASEIENRTATSSKDIYAGSFFAEESGETTHFSIVDKEGNAVAITTTLNGSYGCKVMVAGAGFFLNNEMDDFSAKPGVPNMFGLIGGEANAIEPSKRMLSSMTPTIIEKESELFMVTGSPGGSKIITAVFQSILNVIEFDMTMQESVNAPRFHHQWMPDIIVAEKNCIPPPIRSSLLQMGHEITEIDNMGRVDAILVLSDGTLEGGADPRGDDAADGF